MTSLAAYRILSIPAVLWCAGFLLLPLVPSGWGADVVMDGCYGRVCHQLPERSFAWGVAPWAVCIRCSAIYLSFTLTLLIVPMARGLDRWTPMSRGAFALWLLPAVADAALSFTGIHPADAVTRTLTGSLAGVGLGLTLPPFFIDALARGRRVRTTHQSGDTDVR